MDFTQPMSDEEEEEVLNDSPPCCPICSHMWTAKDCVLSRELHVNKCLERVGEGSATNSLSDENPKPSCPVCHQTFETAKEAEIHVNECLDRTGDAAATVTSSSSSRCPVCLEQLPESTVRRVRHIKSCASKANVTGPRDLDGSDYNGMLDLLIEEAERIEEENAHPGEVLKAKPLEAGRKIAKITEYFASTGSFSSSSQSHRAPLSPLDNLPAESSSSSKKAKSSATDVPHNSVKPWHTCPSWKRIPETKFIVDGFEYAHPDLSSTYFLSHFHYDHYVDLSKRFNAGTIYCSQTTARLVMNVLKVSPGRIRAMSLGERMQIDGEAFVTAFDANHAPGSCVFLFEIIKTKRLYLHTGDFRANDDLAMKIKQMACQLLRPIETIFLDTTYCNEQYDFLPQDEVIRRCREMVDTHAKHNPRLLVLIGTYTIGKERIALACLPAGKKLAVPKQKLKILRSCDFSVGDLARFTTERSLASHWIIGMNELDVKKVEQLRKKNAHRFDSVLAIRATGWVKSFKLVKDTANITTLFVPYSEHSSFSELKRFVRIVNPKGVVPTVISRGVTKEEMLRLLMY